MHLSEVGAVPYGGRWWREEDGVIEVYEPSDASWTAWDGRLFGAYPPPSMFRGEGELTDEAPQAARPPSFTILRVALLVFIVAAVVDLAATTYIAVEQSSPGFLTGGDGLPSRFLQISHLVASSLWEISVGAMVAATCLVAYRYIQARSEH